MNVRIFSWIPLNSLNNLDWWILYSELHMDLTKYYELKQPHSSRYLMDSLGGLAPADVVGAKLEDFGAPPSSCCSPVLATGTSGVRRSKSPAQSCLSSIPAEEHSGALVTHGFVDGAAAKPAGVSGLEELYMERWAKRWDTSHMTGYYYDTSPVWEKEAQAMCKNWKKKEDLLEL